MLSSSEHCAFLRIVGRAIEWILAAAIAVAFGSGCGAQWSATVDHSSSGAALSVKKGSTNKENLTMANRGIPVLYVGEIGNVTASGGTGTTTINFNDQGVIRGVTFAAMDSSGVALSSAAFTINIYRQNQKGLTTLPIIASAITTTPGETSGGSTPYTLAPMLGDFYVRNLDTLVVDIVNKGSTVADIVHVCFWLHAEN